jgi:hypothetical protein
MHTHTHSFTHNTAWEAEACKAKCRVVNARFGVILSAKAGALAKLLPIFNLGGGGIIGSGKQVCVSVRVCTCCVRFRLYFVRCAHVVGIVCAMNVVPCVCLCVCVCVCIPAQVPVYACIYRQWRHRHMPAGMLGFLHDGMIHVFVIYVCFLIIVYLAHIVVCIK